MGVEEGTSNGDSIKCAQGFQCLESGAVSNGFKIGTQNEVVGKSMVPGEHFRTYTRRRRGKSQLDNIGGDLGQDLQLTWQNSDFIVPMRWPVDMICIEDDAVELLSKPLASLNLLDKSETSSSSYSSVVNF